MFKYIGFCLAPVETRSDVLRRHVDPRQHASGVRQTPVYFVVCVGERMHRTSSETRRSDRDQLLSDGEHTARQHALDDVQPTHRRTTVVGHDHVQSQ